MKYWKRRDFLRSAGLATLALPFVRAGTAQAQVTPPKRLLVYATPNGTVMNNFWPGANCAYGPILQPLTPFKSKLLVLRGIDMKSALKPPIGPDHYSHFPVARAGSGAIGLQ